MQEVLALVVLVVRRWRLKIQREANWSFAACGVDLDWSELSSDAEAKTPFGRESFAVRPGTG